MPLPTIQEEPLIIFSTSFDLDLVGDMVNHLFGALEPDISIRSLDMCPFQSVILPLMRTSWKPWPPRGHDQVVGAEFIFLCQSR